MAVTVGLLLGLFCSLAEATVIRNFNTRYETNINGEIYLIGNTSCAPTRPSGRLCCPERNPFRCRQQ